MKKYLVGILFFPIVLSAQVKKVKTEIQPVKTSEIEVKNDEKALNYTFTNLKKQQEKWFRFNRINLTLSEVAFSNWSAGGENSVSALLNAKFRRRYTERTFFWDNELDFNYGVIAQTGQAPRKTDDKLSLVSGFGYRGNSKSFWYYTAKFQFLTQVNNGYAYPNRETAVSKFLAPGYFYFGLGMEYAPKNDFNLFLSPLTWKATVVINERLSDKGAFGVTAAEYAPDGSIIKKGERVHTELGFSVSGNWKTKVYDDVFLENSFSFYGDYLKNFGNIDIDWESNVNFKVNTYIQARIGIHIKYDDDVKFYSYKDMSGKNINYGARTQLKQVLGIGLSYIF